MRMEYKIERHLATLAGAEGGFRKEVNIIAWGDKQGKLDIRRWSGEQCGRGLTLSDEEGYKLY